LRLSIVYMIADLMINDRVRLSIANFLCSS
jgi:hypothetical protein